MKWAWFIAFLFIITGCGTGVNAPVELKGGDDSMETTDWLFDVVTEQSNGELIVTMAVTNNQEKDSSIDFSSGQKYEIVLLDQNGVIKYRYSEGKMFTMALVHETFAPSETKKYQETIQLEELEPGTYMMEVKFIVAAINGKANDSDTFMKQVEIEIK
ncbi:BsuPI-related putative proteinase inhibitor [Halalkalibacter krulwichiae]|uniref:Intracellular proteinase inhibitor n=1 Tax=Halalkalibacter krulwichiae TaxID=199441 RepID=A0A1X9MG77_9BACI|nr:BsuPI-related putative proteinase inhibitor [Halalkalibacter krulwichiae]ARK31520.1 Intracellular proteinase inhibitor [Halalkalibacter krulwichiae]